MVRIEPEGEECANGREKDCRGIETGGIPQ